jgi:DMSO/TMAO reductase YedYZ molybdopterin-dependent catalytic subunit
MIAMSSVWSCWASGLDLICDRSSARVELRRTQLPTILTRRGLLKQFSGIALFHPLFLSPAAAVPVNVTNEPGMIVRSARFLDLEMPQSYFGSWLTSVPHFFVRNHMHEPSTWEAAEWRLNIGGEVQNQLSLSLVDLGKMAPHTVTNTLECAGNGRAFQTPKVPGVQWQRGAVGTARFQGARLRDLLLRAGLKSGGKHVTFRGLDEVPGKVPPFVRSVPIEKAMHEDTLIALRMNGAPLTRHHGYPARALVPGWIGAASCKWLTEIQVSDKEYEGNFMKPGYRMPNEIIVPGGEVNPENTHSITSLGVKSVIAQPTDNSSSSREVTIRGAAWAGEANVTRVDISIDSGRSWRPARLAAERARYCWRLWEYVWQAPSAGEYTIMSRATDDQGRTQPQTAAWNPSGYLYNAIDQVKIHVHS